MQNRNRLTDIENKFVVTIGEGEKERCTLGYGIKRHKLLCIKEISDRVILYSTGKYSHYFVITLNRV